MKRIPIEDLPRTNRRCIVCCVNGKCHLPEADWHGKPTGYINHYCRCRDCNSAYSKYTAERRAKANSKTVLTVMRS